jgi:pyruvate dehydrogenase E2 component (dihydrolipoamide acetyltransferase)
MRKIIAARMSEAKRTIPHFRLTAQLEIHALVELRKDLLATYPEAKLSLNDLLIKACAMALIDEPAVNLQWAESEIRQYSTADIAVVVSVVGGLSTPVIWGANSKSIFDISREVKDFAARAATNTLTMKEISGGSFSISNLGMFGVDQFDAIINPPQCAILAVGAAKTRATMNEKNKRHVATRLTVTLSCDHRAIDGAAGAKFLSALRARVEQPGHLWPGDPK